MENIILNNTQSIQTTAKSGSGSSLDALLQEAVQSSGSAAGSNSGAAASTTSQSDSGISISTADTQSIQTTAKSGL